MTEIRAYSHRDYRNCFLPRDVLDALGEPRHVRQGRLYVFAASAASAWRRLSTLDMAPSSARQLEAAVGGFIYPLIDAGLNADGAIYAMPMNGWAVVSITQDLSDRIIDHIGEIRDGRLIFAAARKELTDQEYLQAVQLCRKIVDAHDSDDGGPTVAGSFLGELRSLLTNRTGASHD